MFTSRLCTEGQGEGNAPARPQGGGGRLSGEGVVSSRFRAFCSRMSLQIALADVRVQPLLRLRLRVILIVGIMLVGEINYIADIIKPSQHGAQGTGEQEGMGNVQSQNQPSVAAPGVAPPLTDGSPPSNAPIPICCPPIKAPRPARNQTKAKTYNMVFMLFHSDQADAWQFARKCWRHKKALRISASADVCLNCRDVDKWWAILGLNQ